MKRDLAAVMEATLSGALDHGNLLAEWSRYEGYEEADCGQLFNFFKALERFVVDIDIRRSDPEYADEQRVIIEREWKRLMEG